MPTLDVEDHVATHPALLRRSTLPSRDRDCQCWCSDSNDRPDRHGRSKKCTMRCAGGGVINKCGGTSRLLLRKAYRVNIRNVGPLLVKV